MTRVRESLPAPATRARFVLCPHDAVDCTTAGGKAHALARLAAAIPEVPDWFVIRPEAFAAVVGDERARAIESGRENLAGVALNEEIVVEVRAALDAIAPDGAPVAVRSSAVEEDSSSASFAGQFESYLGVQHDDVPGRVVDVWLSAFTPRVRTYRREKGLDGDPKAPAVLVQRMVAADVSGIAFSRDPVGGDPDACVIAAASGLGDRLVSGEVEGDTFRVTGDAVTVERSHGQRPVLDDAQARGVAALARRAAAAFGCPQDIEWAFEGGRLFLLQSRPITTLASPAASGGEVVLWDNSNIVESYSGVVSPLTFSFARHVYEGVYHHFMLLLGVRPAMLREHAAVFRNLLGRVRGRVYYNLLNWYRMLALLPGYRRNRRFLDQMLGVRGSLPREMASALSPPPAHGVARLQRIAGALRSSALIAWNWATLRRRETRFQQRLDDALAVPVSRVETMRLDELAAHYRNLERSLLDRWDAPVLNDFFCMIFFGLSRHALRRWAGGEGAGLHSELLQHQGGIISTEPARRIHEMAALAGGEPELCAALMSADWKSAVEAHPQLRAALAEYMERFGDRCVQELKLESPTLYDDPSTLVRTIGHLAAQGANARTPPPARDTRPELKRLLGGRPWRLVAARWLVDQAKRRVRDRENLRFERTRIFGRVRRIFVEMGKRLAAAGALAKPWDVFLLEVPELLGAVDGTVATDDLRALVDVRRRDTERLSAAPAPPTRFVTRGAVVTSVVEPVVADDGAATNGDGETRRGLGCSAGLVVGPARIIDDPTGQSLAPGEVLIARQTDPGWVLLFASAAGLVVERGSLLSHSAIVARELGIPAVVSVPGVTQWLRDGDVVEVDGSNGIVRRRTPTEGGPQSPVATEVS